MSALPPDRISVEPPFAVTRVDFARPLLTKPTIRTRTPTEIKSYVAVFICFSSRAIHLELVSDLTTAAFLAGLKRFISGRGAPTTIYSDNGTNFTGASGELQRQFCALLNDESISTFATERAINWRFNPPSSPHMGGLWEAAVRSMKTHLYRTIGSQLLTFEELSTVLCQIEAVLNSRPIVPLANSASLADAVTPGHFLIGRPLTSIPDEMAEPTKLDYTHRWRLITQLWNSFWLRWSEENLRHLQRRNKWQRSTRSFQINDIVLLRDETTSPLSWPLGRITQVFPGHDGAIRVVDVLTRSGTILRRPVAKLVLRVDSTSPTEVNGGRMLQ